MKCGITVWCLEVIITSVESIINNDRRKKDAPHSKPNMVVFFLIKIQLLKNDSSIPMPYRAWTMSPEQSQYIWRKTIPHIEVGMGSGVFTSHRSARFVLISD